MMSAKRNELITRTGPETPAGKLMRLYWQPAALVEELPAERPVKAIQLLGQNLVLFRDEQGRYGLLDRARPHRGADLAFGRREDGGLRCSFHGWLFDVGGRCLETPAEPEGSRLHTKLRHKAYPLRERNGILFAYLGSANRRPLRILIVSSRPTPTLSRSKDMSLATGFRRSKSASTPPTLHSCTGFLRTIIRREIMEYSFAASRRTRTCR